MARARGARCSAPTVPQRSRACATPRPRTPERSSSSSRRSRPRRARARADMGGVGEDRRALTGDEMAPGAQWAGEDEFSSYVRGDKTVLITGVCLTDGACDGTFDTAFFNDTLGWIDASMRSVRAYSVENSWGALNISSWTVAPTVVNASASCFGVTSAPVEAGLLMDQAKAGALVQGYDWEAYDFFILLVPQCTNLDWGGSACSAASARGLTSTARTCTTRSSRTSSGITGANHAAKGGGDNYLNTFNVMGSGPVPEGHFNVATKAVFDWVPSASIAHVAGPAHAAMCDANETCVANGTFTVVASDAGGSLDDGALVAVQIYTSTYNAYYYIEYRSRFSGSPRRVPVLDAGLQDGRLDGRDRPVADRRHARGDRVGRRRRARRRRGARARPRRHRRGRDRRRRRCRRAR